MISGGVAGIAQLVEQLICNQQVVGSRPTAGSPSNSLLERGLAGGCDALALRVWVLCLVIAW